MEPWIDLNADVGEDPAALADGSEERLISLLTSANIACGGHAGTSASMAALVALARKHDVAVGAHPSYPDSEHFGRRPISIPAEELQQSLACQVRALIDVASAQDVPVRHVKPHGALYNVAAHDAGVAATIAASLAPWRAHLVLVGLAGAPLLGIWERAGFHVRAEAFADRRYEPDGTLRSRQHADALIVDPETAADQALEIVLNHRVVSVTGAPVPVHAQTLCVHGDTPNAPAIAQAIRRALEAHGCRIGTGS